MVEDGVIARVAEGGSVMKHHHTKKFDIFYFDIIIPVLEGKNYEKNIFDTFNFCFSFF